MRAPRRFRLPVRPRALPWPGLVVAVATVAVLAGLAAAGGEGAVDSQTTSVCPQRIPKASGVEAARRARAPLAARSLRWVRLCRYFGEPEVGLPEGAKSHLGLLARQRLVRDPTTAKGLARSFDGLPPFPGGSFSCPGDTGASMYLAFGYQSGVIRALIVRLTGCPRAFAPSRGSAVYSLTAHLRNHLEALVPLRLS